MRKKLCKEVKDESQCRGISRGRGASAANSRRIHEVAAMALVLFWRPLLNSPQMLPHSAGEKQQWRRR